VDIIEHGSISHEDDEEKGQRKGGIEGIRSRHGDSAGLTPDPLTKKRSQQGKKAIKYPGGEKGGNAGEKVHGRTNAD